MHANTTATILHLWQPTFPAALVPEVFSKSMLKMYKAKTNLTGESQHYKLKLIWSKKIFENWTKRQKVQDCVIKGYKKFK